MTCKSKTDGGKIERFKSKGTRASEVIVHSDIISSFGTKMRIDKVGGNRKGATMNCFRHMCYDEEKEDEV